MDARRLICDHDGDSPDLGDVRGDRGGTVRFPGLDCVRDAFRSAERARENRRIGVKRIRREQLNALIGK